MIRFALVFLLMTGMAAAAQAQPPDPAKAREKELRANVRSFLLELRYNGPEDKPFYRLTLMFSPSARARRSTAMPRSAKSRPRRSSTTSLPMAS